VGAYFCNNEVVCLAWSSKNFACAWEEHEPSKAETTETF